MSQPLTQHIAAKAIITNQDGKVLVLKQNSEEGVSNANRYHPPGGIVEPGESLLQTLGREIAEETGLKVQIGKILSVEEWRTNIRGEDCQFFGVFYSCKLLGAEQDIQLDEESSAYAWIDLEGLSKVDIVEPSLSVIKQVLKKAKH